MTYDAACAGFGEDRAATLTAGIAQIPETDESHYEVSLGPVGYADAAGDGDEEALVLLHCTFVGAEVDTSLQLRVYGIDAGGQVGPIGSPQIFEHDQEALVDGMTATITIDRHRVGDPACCPSDRFREVWRFDGSAFVTVSSTQIPQPGAS
jgi:hypothetical protein